MAPIQPSASVAATGLGLRYIGEHCYAMSGAFGSNTGNQTVLDFTTGSGYIVGTFQCNGAIHNVTADAGNTSVYKFAFNNIAVAKIKLETDLESGERGTPSQANFKILIPPFTNVVVHLDNSETDSDELNTITFVGRVYGAE